MERHISYLSNRMPAKEKIDVKKNILMLMVLIGLGAMPLLALADQTTPVAVPVPAKHEERHPQIHKAMNKLEEAKRHLQEAAHDYAGHRVKAIQFIDQAQQELNLALQSDEK